MYLCVWEGLFEDVGPGLAVVLAASVEEARRVLRERIVQHRSGLIQPDDEAEYGDTFFPWSDIGKGPTRIIPLMGCDADAVAFFLPGSS